LYCSIAPAAVRLACGSSADLAICRLRSLSSESSRAATTCGFCFNAICTASLSVNEIAVAGGAADVCPKHAPETMPAMHTQAKTPAPLLNSLRVFTLVLTSHPDGSVQLAVPLPLERRRPSSFRDGTQSVLRTVFSQSFEELSHTNLLLKNRNPGNPPRKSKKYLEPARNPTESNSARS
jgi:hypothetical protein